MQSDTREILQGLVDAVEEALGVDEQLRYAQIEIRSLRERLDAAVEERDAAKERIHFMLLGKKQPIQWVESHGFYPRLMLGGKMTLGYASETHVGWQAMALLRANEVSGSPSAVFLQQGVYDLKEEAMAAVEQYYGLPPYPKEV